MYETLGAIANAIWTKTCMGKDSVLKVLELHLSTCHVAVERTLRSSQCVPEFRGESNNGDYYGAEKLLGDWF